MIEVRNISYRYSAGVTALRSVSLTIAEGEHIGLIGSNSSGKTTLARCLNALLVPNEGDVLVDGINTRETQRNLHIRKRVGMVFQNPDNQIVSATVEREIAFGLENLGMPPGEMVTTVEEVLEKFDLTRYRTHAPHQLSGGEKQRLALAAVMAMKPKYLLLDEPTSLLDPRGRRSISDLIAAIHRENRQCEPERRIATVFITQYPEEMAMVHRLLVMHEGRIVMDGDPISVFSRAEFLEGIGLEPPMEYQLATLFNNHPT